ncbi:hypothetical protein SDC9_151314 [bioreactor metagenome]|uniref:Uncharacterized protein n=1 Tax=bioreactor metagenome TaxID=1076179 RepID=A0A645EPY6_9ZZZZ
MVTGTQQPPDCRVQRLGGIGGKTHPFGTRAAKQGRQLFPRVVDRPGSGQGLAVDAPATVAKLLQRGQDCLSHRRGLGPGRSCVVQINHGLTTFPACASVSTISYIFVTLPTSSLSVSP